MTAHSTIIILGAGISGLVAARELTLAGVDCKLLEARDRIGGRALSVQSEAAAFDLGPAWVWPGMQPNIQRLIQELDLETLEQFETGDFLFETADGTQRGFYPKRYSDARRLRPGVQGLATRLAEDLPDNTLILESAATHLTFDGQARVQVGNGDEWTSDYVISTLPGPLLTNLDVKPTLPANLSNALNRHPTWMAAHAKVLLTYDQPVWREQGLSGSCISHIGPLFEIADQSDEDHGIYALFGFVHWPVERREKEAGELKAAVLAQMERLFGAKAGEPNAFHFKDWAMEPYTTTASDRIAPQQHPRYGDPLFTQPHAEGRLYLAGAEASTANGGLIEGAIESGIRAAQAVRKLVH